MKYSHGGNIREVAETYGIKENTIIDFSANINPLGISPQARKAIAGSIDSAVNYPDPHSSRLVKALSTYHKMPVENILTGNGATELIYLIPRALKLKSALIVAPAFSEYERALTLSASRVEHFILSPEKNFTLNLNDLFAAMEKGHDSLWIGNPANPTGALIPGSEILKIVEQAEKLAITLVMDEAFIDFCEEGSVKKQVLNYSNLIVLRSMTKFFALAGLRVGFLFAGIGLIATLLNHKEPWTLNALGEAAAVASLQDHFYISKSIEFVNLEIFFLIQQLEQIKHIKIFHSHANYLLIKLPSSYTAQHLQETFLTANNILIRDCSNYTGLDVNFIRIAVKARNYNRLLINAFLKEFEL